MPNVARGKFMHRVTEMIVSDVASAQISYKFDDSFLNKIDL